MELTKHWTANNVGDFVYRISSDFILQLEPKIEIVSQKTLASRLNVSEGRVSQVINNPGNLTLRKVVEYARALGMKVSIVAYEDGDPENRNGPINSEIFNICWKRAGSPVDFFALAAPIATTPLLDFNFYRSPTKITNRAQSVPDKWLRLPNQSTTGTNTTHVFSLLTQ